MTPETTSADLRMSNEDRELVSYLRVREQDHDQVSGAAADLIERLAPVPVVEGFGVGAWARTAQDNAKIIAELKARTVRVEDGPDGRGGDFSHEESDPLAARAAEEIQRLTEELRQAHCDLESHHEHTGLVPHHLMQKWADLARSAEADRDRLTETRRELVEALKDARFFIQDALTNGHLSGGDVGNLMGARDVIDRAVLKALGDAK